MVIWLKTVLRCGLKGTVRLFESVGSGFGLQVYLLLCLSKCCLCCLPPTLACCYSSVVEFFHSFFFFLSFSLPPHHPSLTHTHTHTHTPHGSTSISPSI